MKRFFEKFGITVTLENAEALYAAATREMELFGDAILSFDKYPVFTYMKEDIRRVADAIRADSDLVLYCYLLNAAVRGNDAPAISALSAPRAEEKSGVYDSLSLFALLYELPKMVAQHRRRGVPSDVTAATLEMFQNQVGDYVKLHGRIGLSTYVRWMLKFVRCEIVRVGRFNLETCKYSSPFDIYEREGELVALANGALLHESGRMLGSVGASDGEGVVRRVTVGEGFVEGYPSLGDRVAAEPIRLLTSEWRRVLTAGDRVISVHIPAGGPLSPEICDADLRRGAEIIERCFSDYQSFYCNSWLLDTELKAITGKEGNVTRFGDRFTRFPVKSDGSAVYSYVFECSPDTPAQQLPENSSFASAIKRHILSGGTVYGAAGVFGKFSDQTEPPALIPRPVQIVVDDVGWFNGEDDRAAGGPSRTGMSRRHVAEDIRALNSLGEALDMKINCAFVVGEWDPDNRLAAVPHLSKYGDDWNNAAHLDREEMARFAEAINDSPYVEVALHGLLHGYYMDGVDNVDLSDYYYRKDKVLVMAPEQEIRLRVEKFRELLAYYGIKKEVTSFVPPSFNYRWGELSGVVAPLGIRYCSTIFRTLEPDGYRPEIVDFENGVVTVDRNMNIYPWDEESSSFEDIPPVTGVFGAHWPNFLHADPSRSGEVIRRAVAYFKRCGKRYGAVLSRGIEFCAVQSAYHRFASVTFEDGKMRIDLSRLADTPVGVRPFVVSFRRHPVCIDGGSIRLLEEQDGFSNFEITPSARSIEITL